MGSKRIDLTINGIHKAKEAFNQVHTDIKKLGSNTKSVTSAMNSSLNSTKKELLGLGTSSKNASSAIKSSMESSKNSLETLKVASEDAKKGIERIGEEGHKSGLHIHQGMTHASDAAKRLHTSFNTASNGIVNGTHKIKTALNEVKTIAGSLSSSFSGLGGIIASAMGGWTLNEMVTSAGHAESRWNRIGVDIENSNISLADAKKLVGDLSEKYGLLTGDSADTYENLVRFNGASANTNKIFEGILATSKLTGKTSDEIFSAIQSGELGRNKALQKSVLTEEQRNKYLADGKLTNEEIGQILDENTKKVEKNKQLTSDSESAWNRMTNRVNKLKKTIGDALLPVVNTAADVIGKVADGFITLNKMTNGWAGLLVGVGIAAVALGAPFAILGKVLKSGYDSAKGIKDSLSKTKCPKSCDTGSSSSSSSKTNNKKNNEGFLGGTKGILKSLGIVLVPSLASLGSGYGTQKVGQTLGLNQPKIDVMSSMSRNMPGSGMMSELGQIMGGKKFNPMDMLMSSMPGLNPLSTSLKGLQGMKLDFDKYIAPIFKGWKLPQIKIPNLGSISSWIQSKIPKINWKWPNLGSIGAWIRSKVPRLNWKWPTWGSIASWIQGKIGHLRFPSISWGSVASWIQSKIPQLHWPSGPGGFLSNVYTGAVSAYNKVKAALTPKGPGDGVDYNNLSLNYEDYAGTKKNAITASNCLSGNCMDMSIGLMAMNGGRGSLVMGTWNNGPHMWYKDPSGRQLDPARKALQNTWMPPARGPSSNNGRPIIIQGDVYGFDDFAQKVEKANNQIMGPIVTL